MIKDCEARKIDLIVTKSVSRFARNILDCIGYVRQLANMQPPIGVFFETENIYTLKSNSEMLLSFMATMAQEESHTKSEIMNSSIEMRFRRGIFLTPPLLGYDQDEDSNLVINENEANTVRLVFFMYLYGYTCVQIAETLTKLGRRTKKNNTTWSPGSILQILQNERHCGDVLARKTWTPSYLSHKSKKNKQDRNQYRKRNHHEPIISREFDRVPYIEILVHPSEHLFIVRPCTKETKNSIQWTKIKEEQYYPRNISCAAYINTLYEIFGWNLGCKYRVRGIYRQKDNEAVLIFDMKETEIFIPQSILESGQEDAKDDLLPDDVQPFTIGPKKDVMAYPLSWADSFGSNFYRHAQARELVAFDRDGIWNVSEEGQPFSDSPRLNIMSADEIGHKINQLIVNMEQEAPRNGE